MATSTLYASLQKRSLPPRGRKKFNLRKKLGPWETGVMKNYKMVDPTPVQAGGFGAIAGASIGATSVAGALIGGAVGFVSGAIAGGFVARKDRMMAKEENPDLLNKTQLGKYRK